MDTYDGLRKKLAISIVAIGSTFLGCGRVFNGVGAQPARNGNENVAPIECVCNTDCDDGDPYTLDICSNGVCDYVPFECVIDEDCDDNDDSTYDHCTGNGICEYNPIRCLDDADCDDGDDLTLDTCLNPGTTIAECQNLTYACNIASDCGTNGFIGNDYCSGGDVYHKLREFTCLYGGILDAECTYTDTPELVEECEDECENGKCTEATNLEQLLEKTSLTINGVAHHGVITGAGSANFVVRLELATELVDRLPHDPTFTLNEVLGNLCVRANNVAGQAYGPSEGPNVGATRVIAENLGEGVWEFSGTIVRDSGCIVSLERITTEANIPIAGGEVTYASSADVQIN